MCWKRCSCIVRGSPRSTLFPYTTLFRSSVAATFGWTVDSSAPTASITASPSNPSASSSARLEVHTSELQSPLDRELRRVLETACTSPLGYSGLGDGSHTFSERATDAVGN